MASQSNGKNTSISMVKGGQMVDGNFVPKGGASNTPAAGGGSLMDTLTNRLLGQADAVSSSNTGIEDAINSAIGATQQGQQASASRIEGQFGRERDFLLRGAESSVTDFAEQRNGFGTQLAALRTLVGNTDKQLSDLDDRKQEMLLAGESAAASQIANLQLKAMEYRQKAEQDVFNNLLSVSNFGLSAAQFEEGKSQFNKEMKFKQGVQDFTEKNAINNIALEYGVSVKEGDTLDDIVNRAMPTASEYQKLQLQKTKLEIQKIQGDINKAAAGEKVSKLTDSGKQMWSEMLANGVVDIDTVTKAFGEEEAASMYKNSRVVQYENSRYIVNQSGSLEEALEMAASGGAVVDKGELMALWSEKANSEEGQVPEPNFSGFGAAKVGEKVSDFLAKTLFGEGPSQGALDKRRLNELTQKQRNGGLTTDESSEIKRLINSVY